MMLSEHQGPALWKRSSEAWPESYRPLLTPSAALHCRDQPSGLSSSLTAQLTRPICMRAAFIVAPRNVLVWDGPGGRFKVWQNRTIYLFTLYIRAYPFINICISFLVPRSLGPVGLIFDTKKGPQITWWLHNVESWRLQTHAKHKMWFMHMHVKCRFSINFTPTNPGCQFFNGAPVENRWGFRLLNVENSVFLWCSSYPPPPPTIKC